MTLCGICNERGVYAELEISGQKIPVCGACGFDVCNIRINLDLGQGKRKKRTNA